MTDLTVKIQFSDYETWFISQMFRELKLKEQEGCLLVKNNPNTFEELHNMFRRIYELKEELHSLETRIENKAFEL